MATEAIVLTLDEIEIMTSTVITCANAGLRDTAFKLAVKLLQGSYKDKLDKKYRRKLETIVRYVFGSLPLSSNFGVSSFQKGR